MIFIQENAFEKVVCEMATILSREDKLKTLFMLSICCIYLYSTATSLLVGGKLSLTRHQAITQ